MKTIIYADIFDYPLSLEEIWRGLIECNNVTLRLRSGQAMQQCSNATQKIKPIKSKRGFYFLHNRDNLINVRKEREKWSMEKLKIAHEIVNLLKLIPTIKLIGITGALAVDNAKEDDDIDLFIITSAGLLWTTRFLVTLFVEITGRRRHPGENKVNNKICLNMFVDEDHLEIPQKEQDLFSAHEVVQMKFLWDKDETYKKFLRSNEWVKKFLPNAVKAPRGWQAERSEAMTPRAAGIAFGDARPMVEALITPLFNLLEKLLRNFQLWYMRNRRTTEVIKEGILRFHPHDARIWILKKYRERIER